MDKRGMWYTSCQDLRDTMNELWNFKTVSKRYKTRDFLLIEYESKGS